MADEKLSNIETTAVKLITEEEDKWAGVKKVSLFTGVFLWLNSVFGVAVQKGMLNAMSFGNMQGNYSPQEVFYFTVVGINLILESLTPSAMTNDIHLIFVTSIAITSVLFSFSAYFYKNPKKYNQVKSVTKEWYQYFKVRLGEGFFPYLIALIASFSLSLIVILITFLGRIAIVVLLVLLLVPAVIGYMAGGRYVENMRDDRECFSESELKSESLVGYQCAQMRINKKPVNGKVVMETKDGYFFHMNYAFLYITKDGKNCIYSRSKIRKKHVEENKNKESEEDRKYRKKMELTMSYTKNSLDDLCNSKPKVEEKSNDNEGLKSFRI